ncbi:plant UBX domain-containing protein 4-like [Aristolochia californica]|uniref:plant UBX domain-containing protein 4-like n=1 Tax=Aristolochia californica TaxID=171875 RepID=UPI0035D885B6
MSSSSSSRGKKAARPAGGIRTLADLNRRAGPGSDSDSDGPPEYYTGGEKSGMIVQDPTKGGDSGNDVDFIFDQARQLGAMEGPIDPVHPSSGSRSFTGRGRLLSGETVSAPQPQEPDVVVHNIVFWRNGFTVNDGPLRRLDDPENASFLESIRKSECPKELEPADRKTAVHVNLIRKEENRPEPEKHQVRFQGVGRTLGGGSTSDQIPANQTAASIPTDAPAPSLGLVVDDTKPSTSIQLRLADGTRMVARFNYHHTLADIRAFIDASRPGGSRGYQLQTVGFPPKQLADSSQTIEQAGLANSVVIQKL